MKLPRKKIRVRITRRRAVKIVCGILLLVLIAFGISRTPLFRKSNIITIGAAQITKTDINNYATQIKSYEKVHPLNSFNGSPTEVATDDLILNAAFRFEATKLHTSLTSSDLLAPVASAYTTKQEQQQYLQQLHTGPYFLLIRNENTAYELKFGNKLLVKEQFLIAEATFDTPYINQSSAATAKTLYAQELSKMNNQILPLFQKHESRATMATSKAFDVVAFGNHQRNTQNYQQYFNKNVYSLSLLSNYLEGQTAFNDINDTSYIRGNVGKLYNTDAKIATLKKVGDYTNVFASKSGAFMIVRLESKSGGPYTSWTNFLNYYKAKYAAPKVSFHLSFSTAVVINPLDDFVASITSVGQAQAYAYLPDCSGHNVRITSVSYDISSQTVITGTGTSFQEYRYASNGLCPGEVVGTAYANSGDGYTISDNCYGSEPTWGVNAFADPSHYNPVPGGPYTSPTDGQPQGNTVGGTPIAIRSATEQYTSSEPLSDANVYTGWPIWTPAHINQVQHIDIFFEYRDIPPKCTVCGCPGVACPVPPPSNNTLTPTCSGVSGSAWLADSKWKSGDPTNSSYSALSGGTWQVIWDTGGGTGPIVASGNMPGKYSNSTSFGGGYNAPYSGDAIYGTGGAAATLYVEFFQGTTLELVGPSPAVGEPGFSAGNTGTLNCQDVQPTGGVTASCGAVFLNGLNDNNAPGVPVNFSVTISSGGASQTINDSANGSAVEAFDIYNLGGQPPGANGYSISVTVDDIGASSSGDTSAGNLTIGTSTGPCFSASCSLSVNTDLPTNTGGQPPPASGTLGDVLANQTFTVTATMNNSGPYLFSNLGGTPLGFTNNTGMTDFPNYSATATMPSIDTSLASSGNNYASDFPFGSDVPPGVSSPTTMTYTAPNFTNGKTYTVSVYPDYYGRFGLGGACSATVAVYQHFTLAGTSTTTPLDSSGKPTTDEDPAAFGYTAGVTSTAPVPVDVGPGYGSTISAVYEIPQATGVRSYYNPPGTKIDSGAFAANTNTNVLTGTVNVRPPLEAGDKYYSEIDLGYSDAYVGPGGPDDIVDATGPTTNPAHFTIENDPFFKVYGSGVYAGGSFSNIDSSCSGGGGLASWNNDSGTYPSTVDYGASAQFSALALGQNVGFASAQTANFERLPTALSFANTNGSNISNDTYNPKLGGNFGATQCLTTQTAETNATTPPSTTINVGSLASGSYKKSGNVTLNAGQIGLNKNVSLFVNGNVYITGGADSGITYAGSGSNTWALNPSGSSTVSNVPSFSLVVSGGSIYISPNIVELDGMYTAEPTSKTSGNGNIYTCAPGIGTISSAFVAGMYSTCKNQLTIYGNFVADEVKLMRTFGSLRDDTPTPAVTTTTTTTSTAPSEPPEIRPVPTYNYICNGSGGEYWVEGSGGNTTYGSGTADCLSGGTSLGYNYNAPGITYNIPCQVGSTSTYVYVETAESCPSGSSLATSSVTTTTTATPAKPSNDASCSNSAGAYRNLSLSPLSCAAEVFDFSPELYLSSPAIEPTNSGGVQPTAITSLPPVL